MSCPDGLHTMSGEMPFHFVAIRENHFGHADLQTVIHDPLRAKLLLEGPFQFRLQVSVVISFVDLMGYRLGYRFHPVTLVTQFVVAKR